jgi:hypothetical protein
MLVVASVAAPPRAAADGADAVVTDLQAQGFLVQVNWLNGFNVAPLPLCTVAQIHDPNNPKPGDTVYVDVVCPNNPDD